MTEKAILGIIASILILVGALPYIRDITQKSVKPHVLSWLGWGCITALGASAMVAEGSTWVALIVFANTISCFFIVLLSILNRVGVWQTTLFDWLFFGMGLIGILLWQTLHMPLLALVCAIIADLAFGIPTIIKTYQDPDSETPFVWIMATVSGVLSMFTISVWAFYEVAYPLYLFLFDSLVVLLVLKVIKKPVRDSIAK